MLETYCLKCFHSYSTEKKLKNYEKVCNEHHYCYIKMPVGDNKISKCNNGEKSLNYLIVYTDLPHLRH